MQLELKTYLYDIAEAGQLIATFTADKPFTDYERDAMLRSAVERQFEIIGEALTRLARLDQALAERITEYRRIIAFRNILAHPRQSSCGSILAHLRKTWHDFVDNGTRR